MAMYYFRVRESEVLFEDKDGIELADLDAAWQRAIYDARLITRSGMLTAPTAKQWIEIADGSGAIIASVPFALALQLNSRAHAVLGIPDSFGEKRSPVARRYAGLSNESWGCERWGPAIS